MKSLVFAMLLAAAIVLPAAPAQAEDATAALQAKFDALAPGDTLTLDPQTYWHGGILQIKVPNVRINGNGATLQATNDLTSAVQIKAPGVSLSNITLSAPRGGPRYSANEQHKLTVEADGVTLSDVTIDGSAAAGVFVYNRAGDFRFDRVTVRDSRADGIHMTDGAHDGVVNNPLTERTGDDGVAVISYTERAYGRQAPPCRNITINSPVVNGTTWGRGVSVGGGENVTYNNVRVSGTSGAGIYVTTEGAPFFTQNTTHVRVNGGTVTGANWTPGVVMGAIAVYGEHPGYATTDVAISDITVADTPANAERDIVVWVKDGGSVGGISLRNIAIQRSAAAMRLYSDAPRETYTVSGLTVDGTPTDVP
ncbi:right-handed parallel beta-helix repeat-containing protein [Mycobacterium sp. MYCO198283]|uniref:right-handed parallel beta-helix repeat-containing protein n=1 Tax=Mycobacterium sp. MYCO198283 TaxID=2883505 RepID=UPI001E468E47|nr:right-handed parallel beta-helix repeat-containing protein [Mycobacterium sp. MYCO198283]MCG5432099.1 right-handed parallel beta-helix repeat-containing protein [Mycobacterium sp. MYCO198283]